MTEPVPSLAQLETALRELLADLDAAAAAEADRLERVLPEHRDSAVNLVHYVAVRQHDLRPLQRALTAYGLSSLGRMESMVRPWLLTVLETVRALQAWEPRREIWGPLELGSERLRANTDALLGPAPEGTERSTRIMVTMPSEAANDAELVAALAASGMDIARVNLAHDDEAAWARMVEHIRAQPGGVRVAMDLAGPKLRTGPLEAGPRVVKVKPMRDRRGVVTAPASILFTTQPGLPMLSGLGPAVIPVTLIAAAVGGDGGVEAGRHGVANGGAAENDAAKDGAAEDGGKLNALRLRDARGRRRELTVDSVTAAGILVHVSRTTYFETGQELRAENGRIVAVVGELPEVPGYLTVHTGDIVRLQRHLDPQPATAAGPHRIGCTLAAAFEDARPGEAVRFDDGKIDGVIREVTGDEIVVEITRAAPNGTKLRAEKGINLPDTALHIPALTVIDRSHLDFLAANADIADLSFVRSAEDVADLIHELDARSARHVGIVLKIETRTAFEQLPQMLLEAQRWPQVGVMIARGDLAVEVGFDRLAEVQEEILWICEAARVPVIWATEVLNTLARTGVASRAEVTDAAMSRRAEGVMLNKGPYIVEATTALARILERMGGHLAKKRTLLRALASFDLD